MSVDVNNYVLIENEQDLKLFYEANREVNWLAFDTEFVGEKRFYTLLCLIQVATVNGYYLIDSLKVKDLTPFLQMVEDPNICKITHAGENDYRLLHTNFGTIPRHVFDTQVAAGFVGYKYPVSFSKLVEKEIGVFLRKGYTVSDWESRPFNAKQLKYALNDIIFLEELWQKLSNRLAKMQRSSWVVEEFQKMEQAEFYQTNPYREAFANSLILGLNPQEQVFLIRLYNWRREQAQRKDYSKEMILPAKYIGAIVRNMKSGKGSLLNHRRIPNKLIENNWQNFNALYQAKITEEEREVLRRIPIEVQDSQRDDTLLEMLHLIIKFTCQTQKVAPDLVLPRSSFKKMKADASYFDARILKGWRRELLGEKIISFLEQRERLDLILDDGQCSLVVKD